MTGNTFTTQNSFSLLAKDEATQLVRFYCRVKLCKARRMHFKSLVPQDHICQVLLDINYYVECFYYYYFLFKEKDDIMTSFSLNFWFVQSKGFYNWLRLSMIYSVLYYGGWASGNIYNFLVGKPLDHECKVLDEE